MFGPDVARVRGDSFGECSISAGGSFMKFARFLAIVLAQLLTVTAAFAATVQFANPVVYNSGGQETNFVVAADVNGDSHPDMIVANTDGITVLLNNGDGTFAPPVAYPSGGTR